MLKSKVTLLSCLTIISLLYPGAPAPAKSKAKPAVSSAKGTVRADASGALRNYSARLWNKILPNWIYPDGNNHVTLTATVGADGNVESLSADSQPKNAEAETSAQTAFERSKPLDSLPAGIAKARITVIFNSKADPHGDSSSSGSVRVDPLASGASPPSGAAAPSGESQSRQ